MPIQISSIRELSQEQFDAVVDVRLKVFHGSLRIETPNVTFQSGVALYISEGKQVLQRLLGVGRSPNLVKV